MTFLRPDLRHLVSARLRLSSSMSGRAKSCTSRRRGLPPSGGLPGNSALQRRSAKDRVSSSATGLQVRSRLRPRCPSPRNAGHQDRRAHARHERVRGALRGHLTRRASGSRDRARSTPSPPLGQATRALLQRGPPTYVSRTRCAHRTPGRTESLRAHRCPPARRWLAYSLHEGRLRPFQPPHPHDHRSSRSAVGTYALARATQVNGGTCLRRVIDGRTAKHVAARDQK